MSGSAARRGDWLQTYTGRAFWPLDPRVEDFDIEDIAHALAHVCRFSGHCRSFYSVAEHSVWVSRIVPPAYALAGLLHDGAEAYMADIARPLKPSLTNFKALETAIEARLAEAFGVEYPWPLAVKVADDAMLAAEAAQLMGTPPRPWALPQPAAGVRVLGLSPAVAKAVFLDRFDDLRDPTRGHADRRTAQIVEIMPDWRGRT